METLGSARSMHLRVWHTNVRLCREVNDYTPSTNYQECLTIEHKLLIIMYAIADIIDTNGWYWPSLLALLFVRLIISATSIQCTQIHSKCYTITSNYSHLNQN